MVGGGFVEFVGEAEFPAFLIVELLSWSELVLEGDGELAILSDDLLDFGREAVVGVDLLLDQPVLPEVAVQHLPQVTLLHLATHQYYLNNHRGHISFYSVGLSKCKEKKEGGKVGMMRVRAGMVRYMRCGGGMLFREN